MSEETTKTRDELIQMQKDLCKSKDWPMFMSSSGYCYSCRVDLTERYGERLATEHITGCPSCCRTYCD